MKEISDHIKTEEPTTKAMESLRNHTTISGKPFTEEDMGSVMLFGLFVKLTVWFAIQNALFFLGSNPEWVEKFREECKLYKDNLPELFKSRLIHACVLESVRLSTHVMTINRIAKQDTTIGKYDFSETDVFILSGSLLMDSDKAEDLFPDHTTFNPQRFLDDKELCGNHNHVQWGGGSHTCPGRNMSQYVIKYALYIIFMNYDVVFPEETPDIDYITLASLARKPFSGTLIPRLS